MAKDETRVEIEERLINEEDETRVEIEERLINEEDETRVEIEERLINEEYKIWKKNTPFFYNLLITHALEWPSLTVQWLPHRNNPPDKDYSIHKMILGTHSSYHQPNYLILAQVHLPLDSFETEIHHYNDAHSDFGGYSRLNPKVQIIQRINHDGEVNRARFMPQNPFIIATKTVSGEVHVFDCSKHPSQPPLDSSSPDLRLKGHSTEGYGLSWSKFREGNLLSGADDSQICLWDINGTPKNKGALDATQTFKVHESCVEDVAWHQRHEYMFGSVGDDQYLLIWDLRSPLAGKPVQSVVAHKREVNCLAFNPFNEWTVATGSSDKTVKLFDLRKISIALHTFSDHKCDVFQVEWSPKNEFVLASCCLGRRLMMWDISRIGDEQAPENARDGPPELIFVHGGHTSKLTDFSWNPYEDYVIASVAEDSILQIWKMTDSIYLDEDARADDGL